MEAWSLFGLSEHLERLSKTGDPLEVLEATVDFEQCEPGDIVRTDEGCTRPVRHLHQVDLAVEHRVVAIEPMRCPGRLALECPRWT